LLGNIPRQESLRYEWEGGWRLRRQQGHPRQEYCQSEGEVEQVVLSRRTTKERDDRQDSRRQKPGIWRM